MLALISAVPLEAGLLQSALEDAASVHLAGRTGRQGRLCGHPALVIAAGAGKVNAAMVATALLERYRDLLLISCGCGGAYAGSGLEVGDLALATEEVLGDEGCAAPGGFLSLEDLALASVEHAGETRYDRFAAGADRLERVTAPLQGFAAAAGCRLARGPFVTVSSCSGTAEAGERLRRRTRGVCENMEGAAIAQAAAWYGVPWLELRGISNRVEDRDLLRWDLAGAARVAQRALLALLAALPPGDL